MKDDENQDGRPALDREQVVRVALLLLDEEGLEGLSMRRLAQRLGVTAASLYWHVRDKDELLSLVADAISEEVPLPDPARPWREQLEALAWSYRRVLLGHRQGGRVLMASAPSGSSGPRLVDRMPDVLRAAGFDAQRQVHASHLLNTLVTAFVIDEEMAAGGGLPDTLASTSPSAPRPAEGRLVFRRGAANVTIAAEPGLSELYELRFGGRVPEVSVEGATVALRQRFGPRGSGQVAVSADVAWDVVIEGGASGVTANLAGLRLLSLNLSGGVNDTVLRLGRPRGEVGVRIGGGVRKLTIQRPAGVPIRILVGGGATRLVLDDLRLGAVGGQTRWESPGYATAEDRYDVEVGGGASGLTIAELEPLDEREDPPPASGSWIDGIDRDALFRFAVDTLLDGLELQLTKRPPS
jgi:AcrR family transcriptional regulator